MADSAAFEYVCSAVQERSDLDRLQARGTVRIALKEAGLDARTITPDQMKVVVEKILPGELERRGVPDVARLCSDLRAGLANVTGETGSETPEAVFQRLGGGS